MHRQPARSLANRLRNESSRPKITDGRKIVQARPDAAITRLGLALAAQVAARARRVGVERAHVQQPRARRPPRQAAIALRVSSTCTRANVCRRRSFRMPTRLITARRAGREPRERRRVVRHRPRRRRPWAAGTGAARARAGASSTTTRWPAADQPRRRRGGRRSRCRRATRTVAAIPRGIGSMRPSAASASCRHRRAA